MRGRVVADGSEAVLPLRVFDLDRHGSAGGQPRSDGRRSRRRRRDRGTPFRHDVRSLDAESELEGLGNPPLYRVVEHIDHGDALIMM